MGICIIFDILDTINKHIAQYLNKKSQYLLHTDIQLQYVVASLDTIPVPNTQLIIITLKLYYFALKDGVRLNRFSSGKLLVLQLTI